MSECFAHKLRSEDFIADSLNMKLILMDLNNKDCGVMEVCVAVKIVKNESTSDDEWIIE